MEQALQEALRKDPGNFQANHALAELYLQEGKLREGINYLKRAAEIDPRHYVNGYDLALAYLKVGEASLARAQIQLMLKYSDSAELHNLMGDAEESAGDHNAAAREFQRAAEIDPSEKNIFDLGTQLTRYKASEPAIAVFRFGIEKHPLSSQLRVGLGVALFSADQYDEALDVLLAAVRMNPEDERPFLFLGRIADFSPKMADQLVGTLAEIVRQYPKNAAANYCYAVSLWGRRAGRENARNLPQVEQLLSTAVALDPTMNDAYLRLGSLYQEQGKFEAAIHAFEQALKLEPEQYAPHFRLARIYRRLGELDKERQHMDAYVRLREQATKEVKEKP